MAIARYTIEQPSLETIFKDVEACKLAIPGMQRDIVWPPSQICATLQSLIDGSPIGMVVFWKVGTGYIGRVSKVGDKREDTVDNTYTIVWLIIDGQQRVTLLHAVRYKRKVKRAKNVKFRKAGALISYNPLMNRFAVTTEKLVKDSRWINNLEELWAPWPTSEDGTTLTSDDNYDSEATRYLKENNVEEADETKVRRNIRRLCAIPQETIPVCVLDDSYTLSEVTKIYNNANTNSKKVTVLEVLAALIELHDLESIKKIESFCNSIPENAPFKPSLYDIIFIIASIMCQIYKKHIDLADALEYKIKTDRKESLDTIASLTDFFISEWPRFSNILYSAGFTNNSITLSEKLVPSFVFVLYHLSRNVFKIKDLERIRSLLGQLFFMSGLMPRKAIRNATDRFEEYVNRLKKCKTEGEFFNVLENIISNLKKLHLNEDDLTNDILNAYGSGNQLLCSFVAAQIVRSADGFLTPGKVLEKDLLNKVSNYHHIFAKGNKRLQAIASETELNRICNIRVVYEPLNKDLSNSHPSFYWPDKMEMLSEDKINKNLNDNALYEEWYNVEDENDYNDFCNKTSRLMAKYIIETVNNHI